MAKKYSTQTAVHSMAKNPTTDKRKLIMEVGKFENISEARAKFTNIANDITSDQQIFFVGARHGNNNDGGTSEYQNRNNKT